MFRLYNYLLLIGLTMSFSFFLGEGSKNLYLITVMAVSPLMMFLSKWKMRKTEFFLIFYLLMILIIGILHLQTFRISSYVYSFCFVTSFIYLKNQFDKNILHLEFILKFIKYVFYLYSIIFIIQQLCVITGNPPILAWSSNSENPFKLPSLSPEPSHLALYLFVLVYSFVLLREIQLKERYTLKNGKQDKLIWGGYLWMMLTCQSTTAFLFVFLFFIRYVNVRTIIKYASLAVGFFIFSAIYFSDSVAVMRAMDIIPALLTLSPEQINFIDHSAAHRIIPIFAFFKWINPSNLEFWIGNGMDYALHYFRDMMFDISGDGYYNNDNSDAVNLGGIFGLIMDYGVITFSMLCMALIPILKNVKDKIFVFFWCFIALFSGFNTQIFWLGLVLMYAVSFYSCNSIILERGCPKG